MSHCLSWAVFVGLVMGCAILAGAALPPVGPIDYPLIDELPYGESEARSLWEPMANSKAVGIEQVDGTAVLGLKCNFAGTTIERASWDRKIALDLIMSEGLQFWFYSSDVAPVSSFTLYFHSGAGWYSAPFWPKARPDRWVQVTIRKNSAEREGKPAGWGQIDKIRLSAWRGRDRDTVFYVAGLGLLGPNAAIVVLQGEAGSAGQDSSSAIRQHTESMVRLLDELGLAHILLSKQEATAERLSQTKLVILPFNPGMGDELADRISRFVQGGGKIICCQHLPDGLEAIMGLDEEDRPAFGENAADTRFVLGDNGAYLSNFLPVGDEGKRLLLKVVNRLAGGLVEEAAQVIGERMGRVEPYEEFDEAWQGIAERAGDCAKPQAALRQAALLRGQYQAHTGDGAFLEAVRAGQAAHEQLVRANYLAQKPLKGEHRAFWCHSAFGVSGMGWDEAVNRLADNGFTVILPNMLWGGAAFYQSEVLPVAPSVQQRGDQLALCVAACKKHRVECHVWKVNYNMGWPTSDEFAERMQTQGRCQVCYDGSVRERWLCPSHPENQWLEIESMLEVARKYEVDGLHFDYIRYPDSDGCFCPGCRRRFENTVGQVVEHWPADVREGPWREKWLAFRREQITTVVAAVARGAREIRPGIKISAAVFREWPLDRNSIGQDWKLWCDQGYLDFVCPMDYSDDSCYFRGMLARQLEWTGKTPCYPGIGLTVWADPADISKLIHQINITRELQTGGFTIFNYGPREANEILPLLGEGTTCP